MHSFTRPCETRSYAFLLSIHAMDRLVCLFLQSFKTALSINSWSFVPRFSLLDPFCSSGSIFLVQGNCTFSKLSLLLKVSTLMGGMQWVNNYQLYYLFVGHSDRVLYGHVPFIQVNHLLPSIFYSFVKKHVPVDCWGSWSNILGHRLSLGLSNLVSFCIISLFSEHLCSLFLEDARDLLSQFCVDRLLVEVKNPVLSKLFNSLLMLFHFCAFCQHLLF